MTGSEKVEKHQVEKHKFMLLIGLGRREIHSLPYQLYLQSQDSDAFLQSLRADRVYDFLGDNTV